MDFQYQELKNIFSKDVHLRALTETPSITRINDKIYISSYDQVQNFIMLHPDADGIISIGKTPKVTIDQLAIKLKDVPYESSTLILNEPITLNEKASDVLAKLNGVYSFIKSKKKVLIHCKKGMSRSCFVYLYYELKDHYMNYNTKHPILTHLLILLKFKRTCCMIGDEFVLILCLFQELLMNYTKEHNV